jgi:hypothetical protein
MKQNIDINEHRKIKVSGIVKATANSEFILSQSCP